MRIGTSKILGDIDRACVDKLGLPLMVLMENAALKVFKHMQTDVYSKYVVICGTGNNGGDGLALARHLHVSGKKVEVFIVFNDSRSMSECCRANFNILKNMGLSIKEIRNEVSIEELKTALITSDLVVDAIFGTGLNKEIKGIYKSVISVINEYSRFTVSIDIPSGLQGDNGKVLGCCVKSHKTVSFELYKRGFLNYDSHEYSGEIVVESIGVPESIIGQFHNDEYILEKSDVQSSIKPRSIFGHKGSYGRAIVVAGSEGFSGAAYLASQAAVRTGSGLVTLLCSTAIQSVLSSKLSEAMTANYEDENNFIRLVSAGNSVAIGPGLGNNEVTSGLLEKVVEYAGGPIIIDADGINALSGRLELLKKSRNPVIITPHPGEMSRLTGIPVQEIISNRVDLSKSFALEHNIIVLLKGYQTIITDGSKTYVNPTGNSAMASGGMGDSLTGIIASLTAQGVPALEAAACGAYIHGYAGEKLSRNMYAVNAQHIIENIPYIMKEIVG